MALFVALVVWMTWSTARSGETRHSPAQVATSEVVDACHARGETERDEYLQRKEDLKR